MEKIIIYQLFPRIFGNTNSNCVPNSSIIENGCGKFSDISTDILHNLKEFGVTHIWYTGVLEHATKSDYSKFGIYRNSFDYVKGEAGSPYSIKDYYDVDPDLANVIEDRLFEFDELIKRTHDEGLKVIIDFVPNHIAREYYSDSKPEGIIDFDSNNYYLLNDELVLPVSNQTYKEIPAKATGNDCFSETPGINDWYDTVKLNYENHSTWTKMIQIIDYWAGKGVDGFRCDMAEMVPIEFWNWVIPEIKSIHKDLIFIAEVYTISKYELFLSKGNFDFLYDKSGMYDTLRGIITNDLPASALSGVWQSVDKYQHRLLNFLENHDEVRIASDFFAGDPFKALPGLGVSLLLNTSPFMLYFGQELGERGMYSEGYSGLDGRTSIFDYWSIDSVRTWVLKREDPPIRTVYKSLLKIATSIDAFTKGGMYDLNYANKDSEYFNNNLNYTFIRYYKSEIYLVVISFSENSCKLKINIPEHFFEHIDLNNKTISNGICIFPLEFTDETIDFINPFMINTNPYSINIIKFKYY